VASAADLTWTATDNAAVTLVDLELSRTGAGGPWESIVSGTANTGTYNWLPTAPATSHALLRVTAHDAAANSGQDVSNAEFRIADPTDVSGDGPVTAFALSPVWPNPVRGETRFRFALPQATHVRLSLLDVQGRERLRLAEGTFAAGRHALDWRPATAGLGPGLYFVRLSLPGRDLTRRFAVVR